MIGQHRYCVDYVRGNGTVIGGSTFWFRWRRAALKAAQDRSKQTTAHVAVWREIRRPWRPDVTKCVAVARFHQGRAVFVAKGVKV